MGSTTNSVWLMSSMDAMNTNRRHAVAALIAAGLLWGTTVPLSKLALEWLSPGWLTAARFGLAATVLLAAILLTAGWTSGRAKLRAAFTPKVLAWGMLGYGGSVMVQNAGISRTSVTHAALLIGAVPVLVAVIAALWQHSVARPVAVACLQTVAGHVGRADHEVAPACEWLAGVVVVEVHVHAK